MQQNLPHATVKRSSVDFPWTCVLEKGFCTKLDWTTSVRVVLTYETVGLRTKHSVWEHKWVASMKVLLFVANRAQAPIYIFEAGRRPPCHRAGEPTAPLAFRVKLSAIPDRHFFNLCNVDTWYISKDSCHTPGWYLQVSIYWYHP